MADDWVKNYIRDDEQKEQKQKDDRKRAELAEVGASDAFQRVRARIRHDLDTFHKAGKLLGLTLGGDASAASFIVTASDSLSVELDVKLTRMMIQYVHSFSFKGNGEQKSGMLRISSDLHGVTQVHKNGDMFDKNGDMVGATSGNTFADDSEVSEFLLKPLLDGLTAR